MKVILRDNYDRESVSDILLKDNLSEADAKQEADRYNECNVNCNDFAKAVPDEYKLFNVEDLY